MRWLEPMPMRITMIEDTRETIIKFLHSCPPEELIELQPISVAPFFGKEIEEAIASFNPDLIILDLRLTRDEESGFRVLRQLKESKAVRHVPVVVCSKFISSGLDCANRKRAISMGADAALSKAPFPKFEEFISYARAVKHEG
jgi:CheY-like chemotaxis protein